MPEWFILFLAGMAAGATNTIVGSGSLITFPTLLALGYPAVVANVTNNIGLVPGSVSGAIGYRAELRGQRQRLIPLAAASIAGGVVGALLLLALPPEVFEQVVPILVLAAVALVALQSRLRRFVSARGIRAGVENPVTLACVFASGVYGGFFGAAQGVLLVAILGLFLADDLQRINALKNVLVGVVNGMAAVIFAIAAPVAWGAALWIGLGAVVGGQLGAIIGRRMPAGVLRVVIIVVGLFVGIRLLVT